jgi:demethylmenaquinone methyltransferase/2-methoxy-6-polyprenyl-1,4-benzoquinol methylase
MTAAPTGTTPTGTTPPGVQGEKEVSRWVRRMFDDVAPRYDLLNHVLSMNADRWWRARAVKRVREITARPDARMLDLCCGSGDLLAKLGSERAIGVDFSHKMLVKAHRKMPRSPLVEADGLHLPLAGDSIDLITIGFGFRNFANYQKGLAEMLRVLKPGGVAAILEFSTPPNRVFRQFYDFYSLRLMPRIGAALSWQARDAYKYLPESVRKFPNAEQLAEQMGAAGFREVRFERMTFGIVALHVGRK